MTASQLALVCAGFSLNAMTFVLGVCVGVALHSRKDLRNDSDSRKKATEFAYWHGVERRDAAEGVGYGKGRRP